MKITKGLCRQIVAIFASFLIVLYSVLPSVSPVLSTVYAQEANLDPSASPSPADETPAPPDNSTPEAALEVSPDSTPSPEQNFIPAQDTAQNESPQPKETPYQNTSDSNDDSTNNSNSGQTAASPSPEIEGQSVAAGGDLEATLVRENADSLDLSSLALNFSEPAESASSATVTTDKSDYSPTGSGFADICEYLAILPNGL